MGYNEDKAFFIKKYNLKKRLVNAVFQDDKNEVMAAADAIFNEGLELEQIGLSDGFFKLCAGAIVSTGWTPSPRG
jgi:hypothetical protein